jgi:RNA polymerase II subunit A small phosphatase-like protein
MTPPLLILDLDETLILGTETRLDRPPDLEVGEYAIYRRPHLAEFLAEVRSHYRLAVWTAATSCYAEPIVSTVFPPEVRLEFFWCRDRCIFRRKEESPDGHRIKDLKKLKRRGYNLDRVLFVDDRACGLERNYGNHVLVAPYTGNLEDDELRWLARYLVQVAPQPNLRAIEKRGSRQAIRSAGHLDSQAIPLLL